MSSTDPRRPAQTLVPQQEPEAISTRSKATLAAGNQGHESIRLKASCCRTPPRPVLDASPRRIVLHSTSGRFVVSCRRQAMMATVSRKLVVRSV